jgi:hypothetical protein
MKILNFNLKPLLFSIVVLILSTALNFKSEESAINKKEISLIGVSGINNDFSLQGVTMPYDKSSFITKCTTEEQVYSHPLDPNMDSHNGDCWPTTWDADDYLYTFFDDGPGFAGPDADNWSMHPARISGQPTNIVGTNISTNSVGKSKGGGKSGTKASGLIAIPDPNKSSNTLLVAWIRNATLDGGSYLIYSKDHGLNWEYPNKSNPQIIPELGHPSWMQAGKRNESAKDKYLYFYTQNKPTAYLLADDVILGRVLTKNVLDLSKYEYFSGTTNKPSWTKNIANRTSVFAAKGQCYRVGVTYNPGLNRYFLVTSTGGAEYDGEISVKGKFHNLGIYESKNPWGPWNTVYWNDNFSPWGTFCPQVVPKWISPDGKTFWLLYSCWPNGPYKFNLQKVTLEVSGDK